MTGDCTRAACLTPPSAGGVAVVQVIGPDAPRFVNRYLTSQRPLDLATLAHDELRLCHFADDSGTIDDILVCVRRVASGSWIIDLNLHGGQRIVQRVLMALRDGGAEVVPAADMLRDSSTARDAIEREAMDCLLAVQTRAVCMWLLRAQDALRDALVRCLDLIRNGNPSAAGDLLTQAISAGAVVPMLLQGARVVVIGRPNAGKSTLVNRLAEREQILVSPIPGTTRDYVEQPAAIEGVPLVLVDTAGIRTTDDELEREAIFRTRQQIESADLILHLIDASSHQDAGIDELEFAVTGAREKVLVVWNKLDLPLNHCRQRLMASVTGCRISATTGEGLGGLRNGILEALGLREWSERLPVAFTHRQINLLARCARHLDSGYPDLLAAAECIRECITGSTPSDDASPSE